MEFYRCEHCGNIIAFVKNKGVPVMCCGQKMTKIEPQSIEASFEKHIPVFQQNGNIVSVNIGQVDHPMVQEHFIEWIAIETKTGNQRKTLLPNEKPKMDFALVEGDKLVSVYAYCNLHGLWKA